MISFPRLKGRTPSGRQRSVNRPRRRTLRHEPLEDRMLLAVGDLLQTFDNPTPEMADWFSYAIAPVGDNVLVGALHDNTGADNTGTAYLFDRDGNLLLEFLNPSPDPNDEFSFSVASLGDDVLIAAPRDDTAELGAASVYTRHGQELRFL